MPARRVPFLCALLFAGPAAVAQSPAEPTTWVYAVPNAAAGRSAVADDTVAPPATADGVAPFLDGRAILPPAGIAATPCGPDASVFSPGHSSVQALFGFYSSSRPGPRDRTFTYLPATFRYGWMGSEVADDGQAWQGNVEYLCEVTAAAIVSDYGNFFVAPAGVVRYNFARPDATVVPYTQFGLGFVLNDAYKDKDQHAIGAMLEFIAHLDVGAHYFVSENWSLDVEGGMTHISNSKTAGRNYGVNCFGAVVGFTYYFPTGGR